MQGRLKERIEVLEEQVRSLIAKLDQAERRSANPTPVRRGIWWAKLDAELTRRGDAAVSLYRHDGTSLADTGETLDPVHDALLLTDQTLAAGTMVLVEKFPDGKWWVTQAGCAVDA
ncbi:MAG: hypothetical protein GY838_03895 [bacterium]|nr:hypothetical protein [bacterium]